MFVLVYESITNDVDDDDDDDEKEEEYENFHMIKFYQQLPAYISFSHSHQQLLLL
jgi:hypothetical protein